MRAGVAKRLRGDFLCPCVRMLSHACPGVSQVGVSSRRLFVVDRDGVFG